MFLRMIRGWFTEVQLARGQDGTRIPESGMTARTSRSDSVSESASSGVLDGAGVIGDSIGITGMQCTTTAGTTRGATRFITGAVSPGEETRAADLMVAAAELVAGPTPGAGLAAGTSANAAEFLPAPTAGAGLSTGTGRRLEAMLNLAVRAVSARAPSAVTTMADRPGAFHLAEAPAWVAVRVGAAARVGVADRAAVAAGVIKQNWIMFRVA